MRRIDRLVNGWLAGGFMTDGDDGDDDGGRRM